MNSYLRCDICRVLLPGIDGWRRCVDCDTERYHDEFFGKFRTFPEHVSSICAGSEEAEAERQAALKVVRAAEFAPDPPGSEYLREVTPKQKAWQAKREAELRPSMKAAEEEYAELHREELRRRERMQAWSEEETFLLEACQAPDSPRWLECHEKWKRWAAGRGGAGPAEEEEEEEEDSPQLPEQKRHKAPSAMSAALCRSALQVDGIKTTDLFSRRAEAAGS